jgi:conjugal transfer ATP-binding protein TraC
VLLLRQKPESLAAASDNKRIFVDEQARDLLMSVDTVQGKYSEIAIRGPGGLSIGRLIVDRFTEKLYSTQAQEFQYVQDRVAAGRTIDQAVEELVAQAGAR